MSEPIEYAYEEELTCPYCGDVQTDSWELDMKDEEECEHECPACGEVYTATCHVDITYSSKPIAKAEGGAAMIEWITDRRPTADDADREGGVWNSYGEWVEWDEVLKTEPWMPTNRPEPCWGNDIDSGGGEATNESIKSQLLSELSAVVRMIDGLPQSSVIDRMSLESRKSVLEAEIVELANAIANHMNKKVNGEFNDPPDNDWSLERLIQDRQSEEGGYFQEKKPVIKKRALMSKHTPEPWQMRHVPHEHNDQTHSIDWSVPQEEVAEMVYGEANASLIAAAPEMLGALKCVKFVLENYKLSGYGADIISEKYLELVCHAIAKAEGAQA